jgi:hypothetical protein
MCVCVCVSPGFYLKSVFLMPFEILRVSRANQKRKSCAAGE